MTPEQLTLDPPPRTLTESQAAVLAAWQFLRQGTAHDLLAHYNAGPYRRQSASGVRSRHAELVDMKLVVPAEEKPRPPYPGASRNAKVWRVR